MTNHCIGWIYLNLWSTNLSSRARQCRNYLLVFNNRRKEICYFRKYLHRLPTILFLVWCGLKFTAGERQFKMITRISMWLHLAYMLQRISFPIRLDQDIIQKSGWKKIRGWKSCWAFYVLWFRNTWYMRKRRIQKNRGVWENNSRNFNGAC